jgi:DNA-binding NarL/FixJ family response regulator
MIVKSVMQRRSRLARAIAGVESEQLQTSGSPRRDLTSEEKRIARHLAHEGKTTPEIAEAIGWELGPKMLLIKLKALNIKPKGTWTNYLHRD